MMKVRVLRPTMVINVWRKTGDVLIVSDDAADRLVKAGLVAIVTAMPAPKIYMTRELRSDIT